MSVAPGPRTPSEAYWSHVTDLMGSLKGRPDSRVYNTFLGIFGSDTHPELQDYLENRESLLRGYHTLRVLYLFTRLPNSLLEVLVGMNGNEFVEEVGEDFNYPVFDRISSNLDYVIGRVRVFLEKLDEKGELEMNLVFLKANVPETKVRFTQLFTDSERDMLFISDNKDPDLTDPEVQARIIKEFDDLRYQAFSVLGYEGHIVNVKNTSIEEASKWLVYERGEYAKLKDDPIALSLVRQIILEYEIRRRLEKIFTRPGIGIQHQLIERYMRLKKGRLFPLGDVLRKRLDTYVKMKSEECE
jgi:hypothetical protein